MLPSKAERIFLTYLIFFSLESEGKKGKKYKERKVTRMGFFFVGLYFMSVYLHDFIPEDNQRCTVCCKKLAQDLNFCGHHLDVGRQKLAKQRKAMDKKYTS